MHVHVFAVTGEKDADREIELSAAGPFSSAADDEINAFALVRSAPTQPRPCFAGRLDRRVRWLVPFRSRVSLFFLSCPVRVLLVRLVSCR